MDGIQLKRIAKTRKGRKILKNRESQLVEQVKQTLFVKALKTSEKVSNFCQDLYRIKKMNSVNLGKRLDLKPFENMQPLEQLSEKNQSAFIVIGSNSKKRPDSVMFSRFYDKQILDIFELQLDNVLQQENPVDLPINCRPHLQFIGDLFEFDTNYQRIKNYFFDFFYENLEIKSLDISKEFSHIVQFTAVEDKIILRTYSVNINSQLIQQKNADFNDAVSLQIINPSCDFLIKRHQFANQDRFKQACKQPKMFKNKENKNVKRDKMGHKVGTVYINSEKIQNLALKKRKKLEDRNKLEKKETEQKE